MWGGGATGGKIPVSMLAESGGIQSAGALAGGHLSLSLYLSLWKILSEGSLLSFFFLQKITSRTLFTTNYILTCLLQPAAGPVLSGVGVSSWKCSGATFDGQKYG